MDPEAARFQPLSPEAETALYKPLYQKLWHNVLRVFLNWPAERIDQWAARWESGLNNEGPMCLFYHETAASYVVYLLIPPTLWKRLPVGERNQLEGRLERAITLGNSALELVPSYDWEAAKHRVETILSEYGERLPSV